MEIAQKYSLDTSMDKTDSQAIEKPSDTTPPLPAKIIIEEVSRNHKLLNRHQLQQDEVSIGRGYQNDIILTEPHICPQHFSLKYSQGLWYLSDNNSINGTQLESNKAKRQNAHQQVINDGDIIFVGKSQLRIIFSDHPVPSTIVLSPLESLIDLVRHPLVLLTAIALFMLIAGNIAYLNQVTESNISQLSVNAIGMCLLLSIWPSAVSLISHLTKNEPRVLAQFSISFIFFILLCFSDFLRELISFNAMNNILLNSMVTVLSILLVASLLWLNSYIGFHMRAQRRFIITIALTTLLIGGMYLLKYIKKQEFSVYPHYNATIMAPTFLIAPSHNVSDFMKQSHRLFEQANDAALKEK